MMCTVCRFTLLLCLLSALPLRLAAQNAPRRQTVHDSGPRRDSLIGRGAEVVARRRGAGVTVAQGGAVQWNLRALETMPQMLGSADPVRYTQMLPGVQTGGEYQSGLHVEGCENSHNLTDIDGVCLYNVSHLLGIFSTFNASHFHTMLLDRSPLGADAGGRLGARLSLRPHDVQPQHATGEVSAGLIASQGTVRLPLGPRASLTLSGRGSYVNLLYSHWISSGHANLRYAFYDANASLRVQLAPRHLLTAECYTGADRGSLGEGYYQADARVRWGNTLGSLGWTYSGPRATCRQSVYFTSYTNRLRMALPEVNYRLPSGITDVGYRLDATLSPRLSVGAKVDAHTVKPQSLLTEGSYNTSDGRLPTQHATEAVLWGDYCQPLGQHLALRLALRSTLFAHSGTCYAAADPSVRIEARFHALHVHAGYALRHQYLHQTGFTDAGLPTEFWLAADGACPPQYAHHLSAGLGYTFPEMGLRLSADAFYYRLFHQLEYHGSMLDYLNKAYDPLSSLLHGRGTNCGVGLMAQRTRGRLTGWVSYTYTHARRHFAALTEGSTPASHERPHEVDALLSLALGRRWQVGATFVYASGTPFTAPQSIAVINGNVIAIYGQHNGGRLHPYVRLDLAATLQWPARRQGKGLRQHALNLSVYNASGRSNELFYSLRTRRDGSFAFKPQTFFSLPLPSLSYLFKF